MRRLVLLILLGTATAASADPHREAAIELMRVAGSEAIIEQMRDQITAMYANMATELQVPPDKQPIIERYMRRLAQILTEELTWEKMEGDLADIYVKVFTPEELQELVDFYESPLGKKLTAKMPQLMDASMQMGQRQVQTMLPKIQKLAEDMQRELSGPE